MRKLQYASLIATCALASIAQAQQPAGPWYAGIAAGQSRTSHHLVTNRETTVVNAQSVQSSQEDLKDTAWKVFGGWRPNDMIAVEVNYADLGRQHVVSEIVSGDSALAGSFDLRHKVSGFGADLVVSAPVWALFSVFGKVGAFRSKLEAEAQLSGALVFTNGAAGETRRTTTVNETNLHYGAGAEWAFRPNMALRLEWERYTKVGKPFEVGGTGTTGEADRDLASIGFVYRF